MLKRKSINVEQYINSFRNGEEGGFNYFFKLYYKALCFFANRYVQDMPAAEDIAEEGIIKLWEQREKINDESHLRNWLYKAVYHGCLKSLRSARNDALRQAQGDNEVASPGRARNDDLYESSFEESMIKAETIRQLKEAMEQLPTECRKVFYKLYIEGKTVKETAEELQLTISTIHNQKARGIKLLRMRLGGGFIFLIF